MREWQFLAMQNSKFLSLRHGEHRLEAILLESECLLLSLSICAALRSFGVHARRDLAYLPRMEGGHTCVTRGSLALGVTKSYARLSNVKGSDTQSTYAFISMSARRGLTENGLEMSGNGLQERLKRAGTSFRRGFPVMEGRRHVMRAIDARLCLSLEPLAIAQ